MDLQGHNTKWLLAFLLIWCASVPSGAVDNPMPTPTVAPEAAATTVALWELKSLGLAESKVKEVSKALRQALMRNPDFKLISGTEVKKRLQDANLSNNAPLEKALPVLKVSYLIQGTVGGLGEEWTMDLKLLDGKTGAEVRRESASLPPDEKGRVSMLDELVIRLLLPRQWGGGLALEVPVQGARVFLDGKMVATTPLSEPLLGLSPGKHILLINKEGYGEFSKFIFIRYNQVAKLKVDLTSATVTGLLYEDNSAPSKPPKSEATQASPSVSTLQERKEGWSTLRTLSFWGAILGVGMVGGGVLFTTAANDTRWEVNNYFYEYDSPERQNALDERRFQDRMGVGLIISGGVLAAGSLITFFLVDRNASAPAQPQGASTSQFVPWLDSDGIGLGFKSQF
jgi:hypothetical protein